MPTAILPYDGQQRRDPMFKPAARVRSRSRVFDSIRWVDNGSMSETANRYRRLSQQLADTIASVPADRWEAQSPCEDWTARQVVDHMVGTQATFLGFIGSELGEAPTVEDDPGAAWDHARGKVQAVLDDPERAATEFDGFSGRTTFEAAVDRFLCSDLVVHRWDLGKATGQDVELDAADMADVREAMAPLADKMRTPGAFGPELEPPAGADEQTRFLAYFGRRA
jgi:uncharacterized protein (TIGR03086 family)